MSYCRIFFMMLCMGHGSQIYAGIWKNLWTTDDQQGKACLEKGQYEKAFHVFQRQDWRATAAYRAGLYQQAAQYYTNLQTADGFYNAGNALAKLGQYPQAIHAYDEALKKNPQHQDALFNRKIIQDLLNKQTKDDSTKKNSKHSKQDSNTPQNKDTPPKKPSTSPSSPKEENKKTEKSDSPASSSDAKEASSPKASRSSDKKPPPPAKQTKANRSKEEQQQAKQQWLRLIPDDPGGLLREKFLRDHLRRQGADSR